MRDHPFVRTSSVYLFGSIANALLPLALLPILTRYLTPQDYGFVATATVLVQIFAVFQGVNAYGLIARTHFDESKEKVKPVSQRRAATARLNHCLLFLCLCPSPAVIWKRSRSSQQPGSLARAFYGTGHGGSELPGRCVRRARKRTDSSLINDWVRPCSRFCRCLLVVYFGMDWRGRMWKCDCFGGRRIDFAV